MASEMLNLAAQHRIPVEAKIPEYGRVTPACSVDIEKTLGVVFFGSDSYLKEIEGGCFLLTRLSTYQSVLHSSITQACYFAPFYGELIFVKVTNSIDTIQLFSIYISSL